MKRIDRETVQRILDAADIVDVVKDFVRLKKRGANYIGLCPFHAERTPSFSVSKSRNFCKCFSCGKGGSPVGFIMEHEKLSYNEALRYLARKYNIEIKEQEVSEEEQQAERERESIMAINEWTMQHYESWLNDTDEGRNVGLAYFRERGLNDATIKRYHLGYSLDKATQLASDAKAAGYNTEYLVTAGICYRREQTGSLVDRFYGRVIFPVFTLSGKVVAFGGRILKQTEKPVGKYVNSPETEVYSKSRELYGLYQAKSSISKKGYCLLVEGYMDVLSMAQSGVENIVASSGTALTEEQIHLLHRFTDKVVLMYDSDAAGIKAALRGVDMLLSQGIDISVVLLPDGDDPDSFAQSHSSSEVEQYIDNHSEDFIRFKTRILLGEAHNDPIARAKAIKSVVESIAAIPDDIKRAVYCQETSRVLDIDENVLKRNIAKTRYSLIERQAEDRRREKARKSIEEQPVTMGESTFTPVEINNNTIPAAQKQTTIAAEPVDADLLKCERELLKYIVRYGFAFLCSSIDEDGNSCPMNVLEFVAYDLAADNIHFKDPLHVALFNEALGVTEHWVEIYKREEQRAAEHREEKLSQGIEEIKSTATNLEEITKRERELDERVEQDYAAELEEFSSHYLENYLLSVKNDRIRGLATALASEKHKLSQYHSRFNHVPSELEQIQDLVSHALNALKYKLVEKEISATVEAIVKAVEHKNHAEVDGLLQKKQQLDRQKSEFGRLLGDRVLGPAKKKP